MTSGHWRNGQKIQMIYKGEKADASYFIAYPSSYGMCTRLGENNVNPKVMQYVMGCWMSGGDPFSTDRSGAKNIQMHRSQ